MGWLRVGVALIGFGGGIVNGGTNALVADISTDSRGAGLSLLGVFFGVGAAGVPFVLAILGNAFSHATLLAAIGALVLVPLVMSLAADFPAPKQAQGFPIADARGLLRDGTLLLMGLMLFLESGMEITVGGWTSTFFVEELGISAERALAYLTLYWLGMMLARLVLGSVLKTMAGTQVLFTCIGIALAGALLLVTTRSVPAAAFGVFLLGAGFAATYPIVLGFVGDRYAQLSGTAFSLVVSIALVGGMIFPYAAGVFGNRYGLRGSFMVVPAALVALAALLVVVSRQLQRRT
jgi:fucose permease